MNSSYLHEIGLSRKEALREYQLKGVEWLKRCHEAGHGGMLCDEMGLGKTCQTLCFVLSTKESCCARPCCFLIVCPLTVLDNWKKEIQRFTPTVTFTAYVGTQEERHALRKEIKHSRPDLILTTYEYCLKDCTYFESLRFESIIVDEGHRLKNNESMLYQSMIHFQSRSCVLLTGTPVQNNLDEMYSLLAFVAPSTFRIEEKDIFLKKFKNLKTDRKVAAELQEIVRPYMLRRTKAEVALDIPEKLEVIVYHPLSDLQITYYKALLMKDAAIFESESSSSRVRLLNLLQQLRKCVDHPYLFDGVEPEPFQLGEHLVESSAKLLALDRILDHVKGTGHKVLLFSQMTRMLDILQDYLHFRGYSYERLDGSVRGEERFTAVRNFNSTEETFVFLLSTRAGGQGLNLTSADTVIFYDHDFNPQIDLQAAARAHRIGQTRPVKIIRLIAKATVEEVIYSRAQAKLQLTFSVMNTGYGSPEDDITKHTVKDLVSLIKSGLSTLFNSQGGEEEMDIESIVGQSANGRWVATENALDTGATESASDAESEKANMKSIYEFAGKDYSKEVKTSEKDNEAFQLLVAQVSSDDGYDEARRSSRRTCQGLAGDLSLPFTSTRKPLTAEQLEARRLKREQTIAQKKAQEEAKEQRREERKREKWKDAGYISASLPLDSDEEEDAVGNEEDDTDVEYMHFVSGDVTKPGLDHCVIVQCADDSGEWGQGGVFSAISSITTLVEQQYQLAKDMRDLHESDVHFIKCGAISGYQDYNVALLVAQNRSLKLTPGTLSLCLKKLLSVCKENSSFTVHLPRLGYNTPGFDWYSTERLIRKYLANKKIHTYVYYFKRKRKCSVKDEDEEGEESDGEANLQGITSHSASNFRSEYHTLKKKSSTEDDECFGLKAPSTSMNRPDSVTECLLRDIFTNIKFVIDASVTADEKKKLVRYIIAYDGNVQPYETEETMYVIAVEATDCLYAKPIKPAYIFDCICSGQVLSDDSYVLL